MTQHIKQPLQQFPSQSRQDTAVSTPRVIVSARAVVFALLADRALSA
jgi:hypothetical protein